MAFSIYNNTGHCETHGQIQHSEHELIDSQKTSTDDVSTQIWGGVVTFKRTRGWWCVVRDSMPPPNGRSLKRSVGRLWKATRDSSFRQLAITNTLLYRQIYKMFFNFKWQKIRKYGREEGKVLFNDALNLFKYGYIAQGKGPIRYWDRKPAAATKWTTFSN